MGRQDLGRAVGRKKELSWLPPGLECVSKKPQGQAAGGAHSSSAHWRQQWPRGYCSLTCCSNTHLLSLSERIPALKELTDNSERQAETHTPPQCNVAINKAHRKLTMFGGKLSLTKVTQGWVPTDKHESWRPCVCGGCPKWRPE